MSLRRCHSSNVVINCAFSPTVYCRVKTYDGSESFSDIRRRFEPFIEGLVKRYGETMIFLLGGPPRVGKSIISSEIRQKHAVSVVSTDTLGAVLENVLSLEAVPDLFAFRKFNENPLAERVQIIMQDTAGLVEFVRRESRDVWKAVVPFIRRENDEGRDVLIEGVAVLPELVSQLEDIPYRVVFIGNQGENHKENIRKSVEVNEHDWMRDVSDQYISAFAMFVKQMSAYIEQEAKKYGFEYIEMDKESFGKVSERVMKSLGINTS